MAVAAAISKLSGYRRRFEGKSLYSKRTQRQAAYVSLLRYPDRYRGLAHDANLWNGVGSLSRGLPFPKGY